MAKRCSRRESTSFLRPDPPHRCQGRTSRITLRTRRLAKFGDTVAPPSQTFECLSTEYSACCDLRTVRQASLGLYGFSTPMSVGPNPRRSGPGSLTFGKTPT